MCGIIAYVGERPAAPILIDGLHRLEYGAMTRLASR